jgi:hypothetical protein
MHPLLAQAQFDSVHLAAFIGIAFFLVGGINQILRITDRFKEKPPPSQTYMTKSDCAAQHESIRELSRSLQSEIVALKRERDGVLAQMNAQLTDLRRELKSDIAAIAATDEARVSALHMRINLVLEAVAELKGKVAVTR